MCTVLKKTKNSTLVTDCGRLFSKWKTYTVTRNRKSVLPGSLDSASGRPSWFGPFCCSFLLVPSWQLSCPMLKTVDLLVCWQLYAGLHRHRRTRHGNTVVMAQRSSDSLSSSRRTTGQTFYSKSWTITKQCPIFTRSSLCGTMSESKRPWHYGTLWGLIQFLWSSRNRPAIECGTGCSHFLRLLLMVSFLLTKPIVPYVSLVLM